MDGTSIEQLCETHGHVFKHTCYLLEESAQLLDASPVHPLVPVLGGIRFPALSPLPQRFHRECFEFLVTLYLHELVIFLLSLDGKLLGVVIDVADQSRDPLALHAAGLFHPACQHRCKLDLVHFVLDDADHAHVSVT